jgi:tripartite-type tricarboxylate transporter receptor subunit TctC
LASAVRFERLYREWGLIMNRRALLGLAAAGLVVSPLGNAFAQAWPQRPVKLIVPLGPGSAADITARIVADRLSAIWHQPVVVENRPGGDSLVGISAFVGAHDDHVLFFAASAAFTPHPFVHEQLSYDAKRDLVPIAGISEVGVGIAVPESLGFNSLTELVSAVRSQPGKLNWGAITSLDDFVFSGFLKSEGLTMSRVPYRDPVSALNDLSERRIDLALAALALALPRVQTGKVKVLAVANPHRTAVAPELPTAIEAGYAALTYNPILGLFGPNVMTSEVRQRIAADLQIVASDADLPARLAPTGQVVDFLPNDEFAKAIDEERTKVTAITKLLDIHSSQ